MSSAEGSDNQPGGWTDREWRSLLLAIQHKQCTPFLGSGACVPTLPVGSELASRLADACGYPFEDRSNLVRVAQYISVRDGPRVPKYEIANLLPSYGSPDFSDPAQLHRVVADLRLPIYLTTNYDDFMREAFRHGTPRREVRRITCNWNPTRRQYASRSGSPRTPPTLEATVEDPVVFHLHGTLDDPDSMVLTEDDYLDFLMYISQFQELIPARVEQAFAESSLLFLGYSLEDMNFKVLFRKLAAYLQLNTSPQHVAVQLAPRKGASAEEQRKYLERHFDLQKVKVYWGRCEQFGAELRKRWETFRP